MTTERRGWGFSKIPNMEFLAAEQREDMTFVPSTLQDIEDYFFTQGLRFSPHLFPRMGLDTRSYHQITQYGVDGQATQLLIGHSQAINTPTIPTADTTIMIDPNNPGGVSMAGLVMDSNGVRRIVGAQYVEGLLVRADISFFKREFPRAGRLAEKCRYDFQIVDLTDFASSLKGVGIITKAMIKRTNHQRALRFVVGVGPYPYGIEGIQTPAELHGFTSSEVRDRRTSFGGREWNITLPTSLRIEDHPDLDPASFI